MYSIKGVPDSKLDNPTEQAGEEEGYGNVYVDGKYDSCTKGSDYDSVVKGRNTGKQKNLCEDEVCSPGSV